MLTEVCAACRHRFSLLQLQPSCLLTGSWICKDRIGCESRTEERKGKQ